jgi:hypothetical protein
VWLAGSVLVAAGVVAVVWRSAGPGDGRRPLEDGRTSVVGVYGELGGWDGTAWVRAGDGWEPTPPGLTYRRVGVTGAVTEVTSEAATGRCMTLEEPYLAVDVGTGIAVAGVDDPRPRPVDLVAATAAHRALAREVVARLGVDDPAPDVHQVVRTDLDGDGGDELLVAARRRTGDGAVAPPGDYGVLFLVGGDGATAATVVDARVSTAGSPFPEDVSVGAVADLNGDGRTEVVVVSGHHPAARVTVYEPAAGGVPTLTPILGDSCGL